MRVVIEVKRLLRLETGGDSAITRFGRAEERLFFESEKEGEERLARSILLMPSK